MHASFEVTGCYMLLCWPRPSSFFLSPTSYFLQHPAIGASAAYSNISALRSSCLHHDTHPEHLKQKLHTTLARNSRIHTIMYGGGRFGPRPGMGSVLDDLHDALGDMSLFDDDDDHPIGGNYGLMGPRSRVRRTLFGWSTTDGMEFRWRHTAARHQALIDDMGAWNPLFYVRWIGFRPCWAGFMSWMDQVSY